MKTILVVGGAGYIGSHMCKLLVKSGYKVVIFDNLSTGFRELAKYGELTVGDLKNKNEIENMFLKYDIFAVMHFSAFAYVGESVSNPQKYYQNNVANTLNLLEMMMKYNVKKFIFSSTCASFGEAKYLPIDEKHPQNPINPYGQSKLIVEKILDDYDKAYELKSIVLRYFNAGGADKELEIGEMHDPEPHLIPILLDVAIKKREFIEIYGDDYDTKDGTCIRDFIHVEDLANAHIKALEFLANRKKSEQFNLGNGDGYSIFDMIKTIENITKEKLPYKIKPRREGDPAILVADASKAKEVLRWEPKLKIDSIIESAFKWHKKLKGIN
jgi:UDP-glucose 4-epimerase